MIRSGRQFPEPVRPTHSLVVHDAEKRGPKLGDSVELLAYAVDFLKLAVQSVRVREHVLEGLMSALARTRQLRSTYRVDLANETLLLHLEERLGGVLLVHVGCLGVVGHVPRLLLLLPGTPGLAKPRVQCVILTGWSG